MADATRTAVQDVLAELRRLALENRRDACTLSQPYCWGPNRAAEAYERAAAIVEQTLGGGSAVVQGDTVGALRATLAAAEANGWEGWADS